jgi:predicted PurR-regulated permease PerM
VADLPRILLDALSTSDSIHCFLVLLYGLFFFVLLVMTFLCSFLIADILAPLSAGFDNDIPRFAVTIFSIFTSALLVSSLLFLIGKLMNRLFSGVKEAIVIYFGHFIHEWVDDKSSADEGDPRCCLKVQMIDLLSNFHQLFVDLIQIQIQI